MERVVNRVVRGVLVVSVKGDRVRVCGVREPLKEFASMGPGQLFLPGFLLSAEQSRPYLEEVGKSREERLEEALRELLQYTGGWDIKDPKHPIFKARRALGEDE
jgi:hypothetical protein